MGLFFFVYTTAILIVCVAVASICICALTVTRSKRYIAQAFFFIFYFLELAQIFGGEWLQQNLETIDATNYYAVDAPIFRIVVGALILSCFWAIVLEMLDIQNTWTLLIPAGAIMCAQALILYMLPYGPATQYLFYTMRQVSLISCMAYAYIRSRRSSDVALKLRLKKHKLLCIFVLVLIAAIWLEDTYIILIAPVPDEHSTFAGLFLSSRNFSENIMMMLLAYVVLKGAIGQLKLFYFEPPKGAEPDTKADKLLREHIDERLLAFSVAHALSEREREILALTLEGYTNRRLAQELYVSEGTIKTHLHNIMKKCSVQNRVELKRSFWSS